MFWPGSEKSVSLAYGEETLFSNFGEVRWKNNIPNFHGYKCIIFYGGYF